MVADEVTGTKPGSAPPAEVRTPKRAGKTIIDLSGMKEATQTAELELEGEDMSLDLGTEKQDSDDNKTSSEADTAAENESQTNSQDEKCYKLLDERHQNKIKTLKPSWRNYTMKKDPVQSPC